MGSCGTKMNTLMISSTAVERVSTYKLLGVVVGSNLKWEDHVSAITSKAARRIWFLKKLKPVGAIFFVVVGVKVYGLQYFRKSLHLSHLIGFYRAAWNADAVLR